MTALPDPIVPPDVYTEAYYRETCMGAAEFLGPSGPGGDPMYGEYLRRCGLAPGQVLVDVGCGRGELLAQAARLGAARAVGVEYAPAAVALARETIARADASDVAEVHQADARALPVADATADAATMLDVVEHLAPAELKTALTEVRRVLRPGGRLLVHTMPNRMIYTVTYRILRISPVHRRHWPRDPRNDWERAMHVNEQSLGSLHRSLRRAGFTDVRATLGHQVYDAFLPDPAARTWLHRLAAHRATARLGRADLWAHAVAPYR